MNPIIPALMSRNNAIMMMNNTNNGGSGSSIPLWIFLIVFIICGVGMSLPFLISYIKDKINRRNKNGN